MKTAARQVRPLINEYLKSKPIYLPDDYAPLAALPHLKLWSVGRGSGYIDVLSYCSCDDHTSGLNFTKCHPRSGLCPDKVVFCTYTQSNFHLVSGTLHQGIDYT